MTGRRISPGQAVERVITTVRRAPVSVAPVPLRAGAPEQQLWASPLPTLTRFDLATGRGLTYEWEFFVDQLFRQLQDSGAGAQVVVYPQTTAAAVWNIAHGLDTKPSVLIVDDLGQQLMAELHFPDDDNVVVIHGEPYAGTAYLRA